MSVTEIGTECVKMFWKKTAEKIIFEFDFKREISNTGRYRSGW
jgi:hypothetical protein